MLIIVMSLLLTCSWLVNTGFQTYNRGVKVASDIFRLITSDSSWVISENGSFVSTSEFSVGESGNYWIYANNTICKMDGNDIPKKMPFLSCEFKYDDITVSMDDFLEETRCGEIPFPVLMAAFTIYSKKLLPWPTASFEAFLRNGDQVNFKGDIEKIPG